MPGFKLAGVFQSGMVLQRRKPIRIWGSALDKTQITVELAGASQTATAADGKWTVTLPAREDGVGLELRVSDSLNTEVVLKDICIGEVWLAGGQSNMEMKLRCDAERNDVIGQAYDPLLRYYAVPKIGYLQPGETAPAGKWRSASDETVMDFSAVAYYFASRLRKAMPEVPVAIIECCWSGSSACAWTEESYFKDEIRIYMDEYRELAPQIDIAEALEEMRNMQERMKNMITPELREKESQPITELQAIELSRERMLEIRCAHCTPVNPFRPAGLYHTMLSTIIPYTLAGFLWYQGEDDVDRPELYKTLLSQMIRCWRDSWQEELPFLIVQLPPLYANMASWGRDFIPIRAQQDIVSRTVPNTYLVCTMDIGAKYDVHPKWKRQVGLRLAGLAEDKVYGLSCLSESPELERAVLDGRTLCMTFRHCGDGLWIKGTDIHALELLCGEEHISGYKVAVYSNMIMITLPENVTPDCIKFAKVDYCEVNLYNSAALPAKPFLLRASSSQRSGCQFEME